MAALHLLRRLAVREVQLLSTLEEGYPYAVIAVDRITVGRHCWCTLHLQKEESITKVVIEKTSLPNLKNVYFVWLRWKVC